MRRRNPIYVVGDKQRTGYSILSDELIRTGPHKDALGTDGFAVLAYLLSVATSAQSGRRLWETSAAEISERFGWPGNRRRVTAAIGAAVKDQRLVIREYVRDGKPVQRRRAYVVCAGGRRFTDGELSHYSTPIILPPRPCRKSVDDPEEDFW
ncbi:hypothetical protein [Mycolicibacterium arseniciresistens]|uniref:Helix-turn-helix domain-containing protein n=2 Tax=Mycolicibacterium TaxID=1866885 RepID=A0AAD1IZR9_MYCMB|nr:hypothetical protein [Mycolicibacterium arseniciresistens]MDA4099978.1 hypothetical protein [Mycolicibacterium monacense DSM 44395]BBZ62970.1 hypothetical protein MMON_42710 [Mycolicibacterium monacense]MDO3636405.1 hypothetical protein [Mycolicibacterium arseniciresistens]ORB11948.1 hypothetical protein BST34_28055 [Mycolicibacterium monacense DSM 44395]QHP84282.1 hypothetical protein EWR22_02290 [Mycolicibacterium monacense DSM 44395]